MYPVPTTYLSLSATYHSYHNSNNPVVTFRYSSPSWRVDHGMEMNYSGYPSHIITLMPEVFCILYLHISYNNLNPLKDIPFICDQFKINVSFFFILFTYIDIINVKKKYYSKTKTKIYQMPISIRCQNMDHQF